MATQWATGCVLADGEVFIHDEYSDEQGAREAAVMANRRGGFSYPILVVSRKVKPWRTVADQPRDDEFM